MIFTLLQNVRLHRLLTEAEEAGPSPLRADLASEKEFAADNAQLSSAGPHDPRIVFAGDSDMALWDPLPEVKGSQIIKRGFGGDRSRDLLVRLQRDVLDLKPAVAVLSIGGNDLEDLRDYPGQEEAMVAVCQRNIRFMIDILRAHHVQVVLLTIFPWGEEELVGVPGWPEATYRAEERVNAMIRNLKGPGVTVVDCDPILTQPNGRRKPVYSLGSEHLNGAGYLALDQVLAPVLEEVVKKAQP
ncbi:MAG: hypothetical protein JO112_03040 [Planctomycetes bacterium]|nr:hypothetical protein [Planctomycetota bacterium]